MSKLAFTIVLPHDKNDGNRTPGFYISTSNLTYLNVKGRDFRAARWGNGNSSSGWKNRFEYGVTASKGATKLSFIMNTSVILPPVSWALPLMGEDPPKNKERGGNKRMEGSGSSSNSGARQKGKSSRASLAVAENAQKLDKIVTARGKIDPSDRGRKISSRLKMES
ncbi:diguanylate cyclase/phosphodiesterase with PAS/PAC and GAF sensor(s) [Marssonina coronariae]|uniref:Diguanylate cyclase/phosphodiesterase with PAS/PAC and GAF sensor(S) n=1 Tax=Diplocarpon coronariae TaxID=2795749 RepID=A0A218YV95_9HELO|nr:diguanylate cyclase/phosphodiesterase with PAS/PAC and GAF sensor(s) [Marssonina coronariae]